MPRPSIPAEKFPFEGLLYAADQQTLFGKVHGLFFRGLEKGDPTWRGEIRRTGSPDQPLCAGDTACLVRDGFDPVRLVVMGTHGPTVTFRCCQSGSPLIPVNSMAVARSV